MIEIQKVKVFIGAGVNAFTMKRGSFHYASSLVMKQELHLSQQKDIEDGKLLIYQDEKGEQRTVFHVREENNQLKAECIECPDACNRFWLTYPASKDEKIYGCTESYAKLNLKGEKVRIWVAEHQNSNRITKKILKNTFLGNNPERVLPFDQYESYYTQPTYVSSDHFYVHAFTSGYAEFDFSKADETTLYFTEKPSLQAEYAPTFTELSAQLSSVLGRQQALPDWLFDGVILGIQQGTDVVDQKIQNALAHGIHVNGVWCQDWSGCRRTKFGYQVMWNWETDTGLYPDLPKKIQAWKKEGIRFLGYINPFLAIEKNIYQEAHAKGYCVKDAEGNDYLVTITTFPAAMIDFTNPEAYQWYKELIKKNMIAIGMGGWMADFGEYLPTDAVLFSKQDPYQIHNEWPALWAKLNQEAIAECGKQDEIFFFTRAGYTGTIPASPMMWTGDQHVDWSKDDGLPSVIPASLSLSMMGCGISHSDIGGYTTILNMTRSQELLMRWEEMNAFSPLMRSHEGNQPIKNVQFDTNEELLAHLRKCTDMHVCLKPYLLACIKETSEKGTPVMRPLFYHYEEPKAFTEESEYLLGRKILCAPVIQKKAVSRMSILPQDTWVHVWSGKEYQGGTYTIAAPMGRPPIFIRKEYADCSSIIHNLQKANEEKSL
jgi:alpha-glucosidase